MSLRNAKASAAPEILSVPDEERQRFRIYSLCLCGACSGSGRTYGRLTDKGYEYPKGERCPECRGEGKTLRYITQADDEVTAGVALITLAVDGEFLDDCPVGLLDAEAEGDKWLMNPWKASARTVSAAARELRAARTKGGSK